MSKSLYTLTTTDPNSFDSPTFYTSPYTRIRLTLTTDNDYSYQIVWLDDANNEIEYSEDGSTTATGSREDTEIQAPVRLRRFYVRLTRGTATTYFRMQILGIFP